MIVATALGQHTGIWVRSAVAGPDSITIWLNKAPTSASPIHIGWFAISME